MSSSSRHHPYLRARDASRNSDPAAPAELCWRRKCQPQSFAKLAARPAPASRNAAEPPAMDKLKPVFRDCLSPAYQRASFALFEALERELRAVVDCTKFADVSLWHPVNCVAFHHAHGYPPLSRQVPPHKYLDPMRLTICAKEPKLLGHDLRLLCGAVGRALTKNMAAWRKWELNGLEVVVLCEGQEASCWQWSPVPARKGGSDYEVGEWQRSSWRTSLLFEDIPLLVQGGAAVVRPLA